jgi:hypothetical protein
MEHNPNAFLLLTQIAMRARRDDFEKVEKDEVNPLQTEPDM